MKEINYEVTKCIPSACTENVAYYRLCSLM